jgi:hypothetical protein
MLRRIAPGRGIPLPRESQHHIMFSATEDLKIGKLTHADAGQMHMYLNYAREHWMQEGENPPVGLILCSKPDDALAKYALEGLPNKVLAREYKLALPDEKALAGELEKTRQMLERKAR